MHKPKKEWAVIDIETAPQTQAALEKWIPKWEDWTDAMFDSSTVKMGNIKDPAKRADKIKLARQVAFNEHTREQVEARNEVEDNAALNPFTGWIFAVGVKHPEEEAYCRITMEQDGEAAIINHCWDILRDTRKLVNHNLLGFDLPFLIFRSLELGIELPFYPYKLTPWNGQGLYLRGQPNAVTLVDTMQMAAKCPKLKLFTGSPSYPSLNLVAKALGFESKVDLEGKLPWDVAQEDQSLCEKYTAWDAMLTAQVANKLQCL